LGLSSLITINYYGVNCYMNNILQNQEFVNLDDYFSDQIYGRIYKITNLITNKIYIGQTTKSIEERFRGHIKLSKNYSKSNQYIHKSMNKYGIENFIIEEIDIAYSKRELDLKEETYIFNENSMVPDGYNLKTGGYSNGWCKESRNKLSEKRLSMHLKHSEELKKHWSDMKKGKAKSKEHREKIGLAHKNIPKSKEHRDKISKTLIGNDPGLWYWNPLTGEQKRIKNNQIIPEGFVHGKKPLSQEHKNRIKESSPFKNTMYFHNPETQIQIRINIELESIPEGFIRGKLKTVNNNIDSEGI
jgi:group I intron endonuclease